jgi:hypothetical protein
MVRESILMLGFNNNRTHEAEISLFVRRWYRSDEIQYVHPSGL